MIDVKRLKINKYYRQPISKKEYENLKQQIINFGIKCPLLVEKNNTIVDGMIRFEIAKSLGHTNVPCVYLEEK